MERARKALDYLARMEEKNILVVTHDRFMRYVIAHALFGSELTPREATKFVRAFHMENTGLSILCYDEKEALPWWVWVWNDHTHLD